MESFPASTGAAAYAYDFTPAPAAAPEAAASQPEAQQALFSNPNPSRIIAFESLTSPAERQSIRDRAAGIPRPAPVKHGKVEVPHARPRRKTSADQQRLEFFGQEEVFTPPQSHIICDAPVAPVTLRFEAALIDAAIMLTPILLGAALFLYEGGHVAFDKHAVPFWLGALLTVPVLYKLLWTSAGRDSVGMSAIGLRLVDFDGNPPSRERRYQRMLGGFLSFLAAGIGLVWALVDEDALTWHDHMSSTFPTLISEI